MAIPSPYATFAAGILTAFTPCCLPVLPPLLSGSVGHRLRPLAIVAGSVLSFTAIGVVTGYLGMLAPETLRAPAFVTVIVFGAVLADDDLHAAYAAYASRLSGRADGVAERADSGGHPLAGGVILGCLLGVLWLPCVGPILGAVLAYASTTGGVAESGLLLFSYGAGFGVPLLGVAYGSKVAGSRLRGRLPGVEHTRTVRRLAGYALLASGVGLLFELDKVILSSL